MLVQSECIAPESNDQNLKFGNVNDNHWIDSESLKSSLYEFVEIIQKWFQHDENYTELERALNLDESKKLWDVLVKNNYFYQSDNQTCFSLFTEKFQFGYC